MITKWMALPVVALFCIGVGLFFLDKTPIDEPMSKMGIIASLMIFVLAYGALIYWLTQIDG